MLRWYPPLLLQVLLELTFIPIVIISLFSINAIFDRNTPWSIGILKGPGMTSDFLVVIAFLGFGWSIFILGWRGAKTIFKFLIILWHLGLVIISILLALNSENLLFKAEAIDFSLSIELLGPIFTITTLIIAFIWLIKDLKEGTKNRTVSPLQKRNKIALLFGLIGFSISAFSFWLDYEQFGTIIGIIAMIAFHEAIRPLNPSKELLKVFRTEGSAPR